MSTATEAGQVLRTILLAKVVPIIRTSSTGWAMEAAEIFATSGLRLVEVTFTVPGAYTPTEVRVADAVGGFGVTSATSG